MFLNGFGFYFSIYLLFFLIFQAMKRELEWSVHLSLPAVLIQLKSERCYNLARLLYDHTMGLANMQVKCSL